MKITSAKNLKFAVQDESIFDAIVTIDALGEEKMPCSTSSTAVEPHLQQLWADGLAGKYGKIKKYEPPAPPTDEALKKQCERTAQTVLAETDYTQNADVKLATATTAGLKLQNWGEFELYRSVVRDLAIKPVPNPVWPERPQAVWVEWKP